MMPVEIEIPPRMQTLPKDERGIPIPFTVWRDTDGNAHFTINDTEKQLEAATHDLCGICGQRLEKKRWFIGGPLSAFAKGGAYIDGPLHDDCVHYAVQACPYLAMPSYARRLDDRTVDPDKTGGGVFIDPTMIPERPAVFVVLETHHNETHIMNTPVGVRYIPRRSMRGGLNEGPLTAYYEAVEFWNHGTRLDDEQGQKIAQKALRGHRGR